MHWSVSPVNLERVELEVEKEVEVMVRKYQP